MINIVPIEIYELSRVLKEGGKEDLKGKSVMAKRPHVAYYLDIKFVPFPFVKTYEELLQDIKAKNTDYIYINEIELIGLEKNLLITLLDYKNPQKELEVVSYSFNPTAILYKIKK